ncbi:hypothetical protein [Anaeromyxobacter paludicola]|uniref:DUF2269 family protein n=1 Tax=Anaeromyxobacter paludicola TaxID=2918171 RepID=A0ABN6N8C5_9BACT|nr:hypothetical protein [Anaeromyxobacter paludicola]BDG09455.1 hypothetical protein AMPC_25680 [Anaeromyxobacter paludicola]
MPFLLRLLHVLSMAAWLGAAIYVPGDVRRTLALGPPHTVPLLARVRAALRLDLAAGVATVLTGVLLASPLGQVGGIGAGVIVGTLLGLLLLGLVAGVLMPAWKKIELAIESGGGTAGTEGAVKRLAALGGVAHLIWLLALVAMLWAAHGFA